MVIQTSFGYLQFAVFREISEFQTYEWLLNETNKGSKSDILRYEVSIYLRKIMLDIKAFRGAYCTTVFEILLMLF